MKSKEQSTLLDTFKTKRFVHFAEISAGVLAGLGILLHEWWIALPLFPLIFYLHKNKPKTKDEEEERQDLSNKALAFGLILPAGVFLIIFTYVLFFRIVPIIIHYWQG